MDVLLVLVVLALVTTALCEPVKVEVLVHQAANVTLNVTEEVFSDEVIHCQHYYILNRHSSGGNASHRPIKYCDKIS